MLPLFFFGWTRYFSLELEKLKSKWRAQIDTWGFSLLFYFILQLFELNPNNHHLHSLHSHWHQLETCQGRSWLEQQKLFSDNKTVVGALVPPSRPTGLTGDLLTSSFSWTRDTHTYACNWHRHPPPPKKASPSWRRWQVWTSAVGWQEDGMAVCLHRLTPYSHPVACHVFWWCKMFRLMCFMCWGVFLLTSSCSPSGAQSE